MAKSIFDTFVNAAVRQIGRDSARVLTNSMYNNKHAVPVNNVNANKSSDVEVDLNAYNEKIDEAEIQAIPENEIYDYLDSHNCSYVEIGNNNINIIKIVFALIFAWFIPFISSVVLFYRAYVHRDFSRKITDPKNYPESLYITHDYIEDFTVIDNRTTSGFRENKRIKTQNMIYTTDLSQEMWMEKEIKTSNIYIIFGLIWPVVTFIRYIISALF